MKTLTLALVFALSAAAEPIFDKHDVFLAGTHGYAHYRIPAIVALPDGQLLAFAEARKNRRGDWGPIDIVMKRSRDGGQFWEPQRVVAKIEGEIQQNPVALEQGLAQPGEVTYNNPVPIVDRERGELQLLFCVEYARAYWMRSDDGGRSFSEPVDITATFEEFRQHYDWRVIATGPGHGIQLDNGRLIVPVWLSDGTGGHAHRPSAVATIYSDDHGRSWNAGEIVVRHPELKNPSETVAVQLADGRVMLNIRNESSMHRRAVSYSPDGATGWTEPKFDPKLIEPICMASMIRLSKRPKDQLNRILFANPDSTEPRNRLEPDGNFKRQNVTVKLSYDEGHTWPVSRAVEPGVSGYSDLAVGPDGLIYLFYERGSPDGVDTTIHALTVAKFNLEWLTAGRDSSPLR